LDEIAWVGTHRHEPGGNQIYIPSYVFMYGFDVPAGATLLTLPSGSAPAHFRDDGRPGTITDHTRRRVLHAGDTER
jgi:hypothetical protein